MSTAAATPFAVPPQLVSFKAPRRSFVILNSASKERSPMFVGNLMTIPPVNIVGPRADTDEDGQPIPGSRVIEDDYYFAPELGEEIQTFDAVRAVIHILGLQPGSDGLAAMATSPFALGGLSLLPRHAPKAQWKAIAADGERRAFLADVDRAEKYLAHIDEVNAIRKKEGLATKPPNAQEYKRALWLVEQRDLMLERMTTLAPHQADQLNEDLEFEVWAKAKALELATQAAEGKTVDRLQLAEELLHDPSVRLKLQKKWRIREVGSMPKSKDQLQAEAQRKSEAEAAAALTAQAKADAEAALDNDDEGAGGEGSA